MNRRDATRKIRRAIATGALLWTCSAAPAFAAALDVVAVDPLYWRDGFLLSSLVLLVGALVLRIRRRREADANPTGPDLRWWKTENASA